MQVYIHSYERELVGLHDLTLRTIKTQLYVYVIFRDESELFKGRLRDHLVLRQSRALRKCKS